MIEGMGGFGMIPEKIAEFIQGPVFVAAGTRDEMLRPSHTWAVGTIVNPDRETVMFFVPRGRAERILSNLEGNGKIALGVGSPTHEAYQLKGTYVSSRPAEERDRAIQEIYRSKWLALALQCGYPEQIARPLTLGFAYHPAVAITFRVEEIFLQTPGPDAGKKIV